MRCHTFQSTVTFSYLIFIPISFFFIFFMIQENELFARAALHSLSTLTLRSKENSQALFEVDMAETIVETMRLHPSSKIVQVK